MNNFYVYVHYRASDGKPFYVGKGTNRRAYVVSGRNAHWQNTYKKHGRVVKIIHENLTEEEAYRLEVECIRELKEQFNCLCNKTNGGDGCYGMVLSPETRKKISEANKGREKSPTELENIRKAAVLRRGRKKTPEQVEKMRMSLIGKKHSEATKRQMSATRLNGKTNVDNSVYVFFSKDDIFIGKRWELARYTGIPTKKFKPMFDKQRQKVCQGWSVLRFNEFLILKEIFL